MQRVVLSLLCLAPLVLSGCGRVPKATKTRDSGQSGLMDESFAAKNACNPKNHLRPFIIEWDGTDMSSFESYAASDIVVVRYEGCDMQVLDECRNDSIRGSQGAYKPVEWTAGSLEKLQIANQGELYAKLPLGSASLGGRVAGGEKFSMEYYVAGTRNATRDAVYREDIQQNPGCEGATHFVYGYNLGAFALGTTKDFSAEVGVSAYGFGAGGKTSSNSQADKQGGDLSVCKSDSATEVAGCKAPIRLTLRPIRDGANPDKAAMGAEDTPASLNAAGLVAAKLELGEKARAYYESALTKQNSGDGKGCLAELDKYDKADPKHKSSDPNSYFSHTRAVCLMISGKCDAGKGLMRKGFEKHSAQTTPAEIDTSVSYQAQQYCQGGLSPYETMTKAILALQMGMNKKQTVQYCADNYALVKKHRAAVKPKDEDDSLITQLPDMMYSHFPACFAKAGDCKQAYAVFLENAPASMKAEKNPTTREFNLRNSFEAYNAKCKDPNRAPPKNLGDELRELIASSERKLNEGDHQGCLADLDRLKVVEPATEKDMAFRRAECEMIAGKCQQGKQRIVTYLRTEKKETQAKATEAAEAMAVRRCKGGDANDRDRLLAAITALYTAMNAEKKSVAACKTPIATIKSLLPKVKPRDASDAPIIQAGQLMYTLAPGCLAVANDCAGARQLHRESFPQETLKSLDAKTRDTYLETAFYSIAPTCRK
jgi:hypothetical protein